MKTEHWSTGEIFDCTTCGKSWQQNGVARKKAYAHAKTTGHKVRGEISTCYHYN